MQRLYDQTQSEFTRNRIRAFMARVPCKVCDGARLKPEILAVTIKSKDGRELNIHQFSEQTTEAAAGYIDNLELPAAKVRVKIGGGIAGHNGLRSISSHIGNDYRRVRLGIGHPGIKELVHSHVLSDFAKSDRPWVEALCEAVADNAALLATGKDSTFQNKVHLVLQAKGIFDKEDDEKQD